MDLNFGDKLSSSKALMTDSELKPYSSSADSMKPSPKSGKMSRTLEIRDSNSTPVGSLDVAEDEAPVEEEETRLALATTSMEESSLFVVVVIVTLDLKSWPSE